MTEGPAPRSLDTAVGARCLHVRSLVTLGKGACRRWLAVLTAMLMLLGTRSLLAQGAAPAGDSVSVKFVEADIRAVIQGLGQYLSKPVLTANLPALRVTLETPHPIPRAEVPTLLRGLAESNGLVFTEDSAFYRVEPKVAPPPPPAQSGSPGGPAATPRLFVIRLKHAIAGDIAATVNQLFGAGGEFSGRSGVGGSSLSDQLRQNLVTPAGAQPGVNAPTGSGTPAALKGAVTIVPDERTNSLLIRATPDDYDVIKTAVDELDIRPLQVLIEVLIVEAQDNGSFSLGADLGLPAQSLAGGSVSGTTTGGGLGDMVLNFMNIGHAQVNATIRAAQSKGTVQIISRPTLIASNNAEASFLVGTQRPFVQVSRSLPTDTPSRDQVVQYKDVGTQLTVKPTINQDGYVSLVIQQEVNNATDQSEFDAPIISTREAKTQVLVKDGQTIVLGGLRDQQRNVTKEGVPILSQLPLIGALFGGVSRTNDKTDIFIFLTPRIIRTDEDADSVTAKRLPAGLPEDK